MHPMQIWQTPFVSDAYAAAQPAGTGPLRPDRQRRPGARHLRRLSVARMVDEMSPSGAVFEDLIAACARAFDAYHWLGEPELGDLRTPLAEVRATAELVLDEFEKVAGADRRPRRRAGRGRRDAHRVAGAARSAARRRRPPTRGCASSPSCAGRRAT